MLRRICTPLLAWAVAVGAAAQNFERDGLVAIRNLTIVPAPGQQLDGATLVLDGDRIVAVGRDIEVPAGAREIDGSGLFAYAGFIDGFSRRGVTDPKLSAADERRIEDEDYSITEDPLVHMPDAQRHGIFARRRVEDVLDITDKTFEDARESGFTAALEAPPRAIIGGTASLVELDSGPLRRGVVREALALTASFEPPPQRQIKIRGQYPGTVLGVFAQFRQTIYDADWYAQMSARPEWRRDLPLDADLPRLITLLGRGGEAPKSAVPVLWEADHVDEIDRALRLSTEFKLRPIIVGGRDAWKRAAQLKDRAPVVVSLKVLEKPREYKLNADEYRISAEDHSLYGKNWLHRVFDPKTTYELIQRRHDDEIVNMLKLEQAGVSWCLSTYEFKRPQDAWKTVHAATKAGLSAEVLLKALTTAPAALFGVSDQLGTIEPGKRANLTILTRPLGDEDARARHVFVDGHQYTFDVVAPKKKDKDERKDDKSESKPVDSQPVASNPSAQSAPAPGPWDDILLNEPAWTAETEASRDPGVHTGGSVLLKDAHVITLSGDDLDPASVLIEKGKITKIARDIAAPAGVMALDCRGYVVMPGILDPHSHISLDGINEWTGSVTPEVRCEDVVKSDDPNMFWGLAGGCTTAHLMHGSANTIGGQCVLVKMKYGRPVDEMIIQDRHRTVKFATGENVKRPGTTFMAEAGDPCLADRPKRFPGTRMGVETTMRRALQAGKDYAAAQDAYQAAARAKKDVKPLRRDVRLEALADIVRGEIWINTHCYRADEILRLLEVCEDYGVRVAALHHVLEAYRIMPEIWRHGASTATFADWWAYKVEAYDAVPQNAGMLERFGINSAIKSDSGDLMRHLNHEAAKCMKYADLTPNEALRLCTLNGAKIFGIDNRIGTLEVGKDGDIAVFDGHPLDSFSKCVMTLIEGEVYFRHADFDPQQGTPPTRPIRQFSVAERDVAKAANAPASTTRTKTYAIVGGTVCPVSREPIVNGTVLIRDGKIAEVGAGVTIPPDAQVIPATGLNVYPGLIDAGTTVGLHEIGMSEVTVDANEIGTIQPDVMAFSAFNPHSAMVPVTRAEGVTTIVVLPGGGMISGQTGALDLSGWTAAEMRIDATLGIVVNLPSPPAKPIVEEEKRRRRHLDEEEEEEAQPEDEVLRRIRKLERYFADARSYAIQKRAAKDPSLAPVDPRFEAMIPYVLGERPVLFNAGGYRQILEVLMFADRIGVKPIILGGGEAWKCATLLAERKVPVIYEGVFNMPERVPHVWTASVPWDANYRAASVLAAAGVKFCFMHRSADLAKLMPLEAGWAVAHGLDANIALRAMTLNAAEILGLADRYGSLDVGKVANIVVSTDHPGQATNVIKHVFIRGEPVSLETKHTKDAEHFADRPDAKLPPQKTLKGPPSQSGPRTPGSLLPPMP